MRKKNKDAITVKELNALAKKANRRIRNLEKKGYTGLVYLTLEYDVRAGRAKRFSERTSKLDDMEREILAEEIRDFLGNNASTVRGYRKQWDIQEVYDRVRDAVNSRKKNAVAETTSDKNKEEFYNFLHSRFFKSQAAIGDSNDLIEIYLKSQDKHTVNEIYTEFRAFSNNLIDLQDVSVRLTGENIFLNEDE